MQYFKKYLNSGVVEKDGKKKSETICYVKQWAKSDQGIIFRLSNRIIQINYNDRSQLMLYTQQCVGVYSDGNCSEKIFFDLGEKDERNSILSKKIDQMKDLMRVLRSNKGNLDMND